MGNNVLRYHGSGTLLQRHQQIFHVLLMGIPVVVKRGFRETGAELRVEE